MSADMLTLEEYGRRYVRPAANRIRLKILLEAAYHASETSREQQFVRLLGQAIFGVDMLYERLPL
jgi:hypothetical protein